MDQVRTHRVPDHWPCAGKVLLLQGSIKDAQLGLVEEVVNAEPWVIKRGIGVIVATGPVPDVEIHRLWAKQRPALLRIRAARRRRPLGGQARHGPTRTHTAWGRQEEMRKENDKEGKEG